MICDTLKRHRNHCALVYSIARHSCYRESGQHKPKIESCVWLTLRSITEILFGIVHTERI